MRTKSTIKLISMFISLIVLTSLLTADDSFARRRDKKHIGPRHTHKEKVIVRHRGRHAPEWTAKKKFFNKRGTYYRPYRKAYYGRKARRFYGRSYGYRRPYPRNSFYLSLNGLFYDTAPASYVVVKSPPETVVVRETSIIVRPVESASGNVAAIEASGAGMA